MTERTRVYILGKVGRTRDVFAASCLLYYISNSNEQTIMMLYIRRYNALYE